MKIPAAARLASVTPPLHPGQGDNPNVAQLQRDSGREGACRAASCANVGGLLFLPKRLLRPPL
jgi:hypothetical protein